MIYFFIFRWVSHFVLFIFLFPNLQAQVFYLIFICLICFNYNLFMSFLIILSRIIFSRFRIHFPGSIIVLPKIKERI
jgi:hypothetical protein